MATNKAQAQQEKKDAQKGLDSANQKANQAQQQKNAAQAEVEDLKTELTGLLSDITLLEEDIKYKDSQIQQAQSDYDDALVREKEQYEAMKKRIRYMYEKGVSRWYSPGSAAAPYIRSAFPPSRLYHSEAVPYKRQPPFWSADILPASSGHNHKYH